MVLPWQIRWLWNNKVVTNVTFVAVNDQQGETVIEKKMKVLSSSNHSTDGKYTCNECNAVFSSCSGLSLYRKSKHEGVRYCCDQCDYKATWQTSLNKHIQSRHEGVSFDCIHCYFKASWKSSLTIHMQSKHDGIRFCFPRSELLA